MSRSYVYWPWYTVGHELGLEAEPAYGSMEGTVRGRRVQVRIDNTIRSDGGKTPRTLELTTWATPSQRVTLAQESFGTRVGQRLLGQDVLLDDPVLDDALFIHGPDPDAIRRWLTRAETLHALRNCVDGRWKLSFLGHRLELRHDQPASPEDLREGLRRLLALASALEGETPAPSDQNPLDVVAAHFGLHAQVDRLHGRIGDAWVRLDTVRVGDQDRIHLRTTVPGLLELTIRRREADERAGAIGDPILDATLRVLALSEESARELLCREPVRSCVLELVHGARGTLDGGRLELFLRPDATRIIDRLETILTLRTATG